MHLHRWCPGCRVTSSYCEAQRLWQDIKINTIDNRYYTWWLMNIYRDVPFQPGPAWFLVMIILHFWISISGYVAAGGKCYPESASPKSHMGLRHTGTSCSVRGRTAGCCDSMLLQQPAPAVHPTGYCEESQGPAMCLEGSCFCVGSQGCIKTNILAISMVNSRLVVHLRHLQCWGLEGSVFENGKCQEPKVFGVNEGGENMLAWWVLVCWCELFPFVVGLG